jgi:nucleotide-binding universal stress UspA family protein
VRIKSAPHTPQSEPPRAAGGGDQPIFAQPLCAVNGSKGAAEATRQAALLAGPGSRLTLLSVSYEVGAGLTEKALLTQERAREAVSEAESVAADLGTRTVGELVESADVAATLLERAEGHDLVAVSARSEPRVAGIALGSVAAVLAHRAPVPVLLARRPPGERGFPRLMLVASDDSPNALRAVHLASAIARQHDSQVTVVHADGEDESEPRRPLPSETTEVFEAAGVKPEIALEEGSPPERIVELAGRHETSLIVIGSRGLAGIRALASVSERVASRAPCSVLIARPTDDRRPRGATEEEAQQ